jgi:hypothetical protein
MSTSEYNELNLHIFACEECQNSIKTEKKKVMERKNHKILDRYTMIHNYGLPRLGNYYSHAKYYDGMDLSEYCILCETAMPMFSIIVNIPVSREYSNLNNETTGGRVKVCDSCETFIKNTSGRKRENLFSFRSYSRVCAHCNEDYLIDNSEKSWRKFAVIADYTYLCGECTAIQRAHDSRMSPYTIGIGVTQRYNHFTCECDIVQEIDLMLSREQLDWDLKGQSYLCKICNHEGKAPIIVKRSADKVVYVFNNKRDYIYKMVFHNHNVTKVLKLETIKPDFNLQRKIDFDLDYPF